MNNALCAWCDLSANVSWLNSFKKLKKSSRIYQLFKVSSSFLIVHLESWQIIRWIWKSIAWQKRSAGSNPSKSPVHRVTLPKIIRLAFVVLPNIVVTTWQNAPVRWLLPWILTVIFCSFPNGPTFLQCSSGSCLYQSAVLLLYLLSNCKTFLHKETL